MGIYSYSSLCALFIAAVSVISLTDASGAIFMRFLRYENWEGKGSNGHCCDGKWSICQSNGCDHAFKICLDRSRGYGCTYGRAQSGPINNQNVITFRNTIANLSNPLVFPFKGAAPSKLDVKVAVYDLDNSFTGGHNDFVEFLKGTVQQVSPDPEEHVLKGRTKLRFEMWYKCSTGDTERCTQSKGQKRDYYNMLDALDELDY